MSVHRRVRANRKVVWQVTWRDEEARQRAETYPTEREAQRRDLEIKDLRSKGRVEAADAGAEPFADAVSHWMLGHVKPTLAPRTQKSYEFVTRTYLVPLLGTERLRDIGQARVTELTSQLRELRVGPAMTYRTLMILSGIMRYAVKRERIDRNPMQQEKVPQAKRTLAIRALAPATVEALRRRLILDGDRRSATLVTLMAYAGLRPGEALALTWEHIGKNTILVEQARGDGEVKTTKTRSIRTVRLLAPLAADLSDFRRDESAAGSDWLFPSVKDKPWSDEAYRRWSRRRFRPAATAIGLPKARPYDLRHSYASLMIQAHYSIVELADDLGHAPSLTLDTYSHLFREFARGERVDPEALISAARERFAGDDSPHIGQGPDDS